MNNPPNDFQDNTNKKSEDDTDDNNVDVDDYDKFLCELNNKNNRENGRYKQHDDGLTPLSFPRLPRKYSSKLKDKIIPEQQQQQQQKQELSPTNVHHNADVAEESSENNTSSSLRPLVTVQSSFVPPFSPSSSLQEKEIGCIEEEQHHNDLEGGTANNNADKSNFSEEEEEEEEPLNNTTRQPRESNKDSGGDYYTLEEDTFSLFFIADVRSIAFCYSIAIFFFQITILGLIAYDLLADDDKNDKNATSSFLGTFATKDSESNYFNVPVYVNKAVAVAQALALIVAVISQDDCLTALDAISVSYNKNILDKHPSATYLKWCLSNTLRFLEGFLTLFVSFIFIVQVGNRKNCTVHLKH